MCFLNFSLFFQLCFSPLSLSHPGGPAWGLKCPGSVGFLFTAPATDPHPSIHFWSILSSLIHMNPLKEQEKNRFVVNAPCLARCTLLVALLQMLLTLALNIYFHIIVLSLCWPKTWYGSSNYICISIPVCICDCMKTWFVGDATCPGYQICSKTGFADAVNAHDHRDQDHPRFC